MRYGQIIIGIILVSIGAILGFWLGGGAQEVGATSHLESSENPGATAVSETGGHDHSAHESKADWCSEHWFPESECTKCKPELAEKFRSQGNWCGEHGYPESHCRKCNPRLTFPQEPQQSQTTAADEVSPVSVFFPPNDKACAPELALIQFSSPETPAKVGLRTESVLPATTGNSIEAPAELVFDDTRTAAVTTTLSATIVQWRVDPGNSLDQGQVLAELESPDMAELKAAYLEADADWSLADTEMKRAGDLLSRNLISQAEYQDADAHAQASLSRRDGIAGRLRSAGLRDVDISALKSDHQINPRWLLCTANAGTLLERRAPLGELLSAGSTLALIGQPSALWIEAHIRERDLSQFREGMKVDFMIDGEEVSRAAGKVIWVAQYLDPRTHTGLMRAEITSDPGDLKAHMFGRIRLTNPVPQSAVLVSKDAVQWEGCCHIVFIQESNERYRPRKVSIDRGDRDNYLVTSGLKAGELVVTDGSFLLKSELEKESLGVGCAGE
jgi:cobalt-zinc-cadmium efflux system membrane fusion protein